MWARSSPFLFCAALAAAGNTEDLPEVCNRSTVSLAAGHYHANGKQIYTGCTIVGEPGTTISGVFKEVVRVQLNGTLLFVGEGPNVTGICLSGFFSDVQINGDVTFQRCHLGEWEVFSVSGRRVRFIDSQLSSYNGMRTLGAGIEFTRTSLWIGSSQMLFNQSNVTAVDTYMEGGHGQWMFMESTVNFTNSRLFIWDGNFFPGIGFENSSLDVECPKDGSSAFDSASGYFSSGGGSMGISIVGTKALFRNCSCNIGHALKTSGPIDVDTSSVKFDLCRTAPQVAPVLV